MARCHSRSPGLDSLGRLFAKRTPRPKAAMDIHVRFRPAEGHSCPMAASDPPDRPVACGLRTRAGAERAIAIEEVVMKASRKWLAIGMGALLAGIVQGGDARAAKAGALPQYHVAHLPSLGGTNSRGNS